MIDLVETAAKRKIVSTLDATDDIPKTAFNTHMAKFQFKVMPLSDQWIVFWNLLKNSQPCL